MFLSHSKLLKFSFFCQVKIFCTIAMLFFIFTKESNNNRKFFEALSPWRQDPILTSASDAATNVRMDAGCDVNIINDTKFRYQDQVTSNSMLLIQILKKIGSIFSITHLVHLLCHWCSEMLILPFLLTESRNQKPDPSQQYQTFHAYKQPLTRFCWMLCLG